MYGSRKADFWQKEFGESWMEEKNVAQGLFWGEMELSWLVPLQARLLSASKIRFLLSARVIIAVTRYQTTQTVITTPGPEIKAQNIRKTYFVWRSNTSWTFKTNKITLVSTGSTQLENDSFVLRVTFQICMSLSIQYLCFKLLSHLLDAKSH